MERRKPLRRRQKKPMQRRRTIPLDAVVRKFGLQRASRMKPRSDNNSGWLDVALEIWGERPHRCEICATEITNPQPINFSHLLPRGTYRKLKRDKRNIRIKCDRCHTFWHKHGPEILRAYPDWRRTCDLYFFLRDEQNGVAAA